MVCPSPGIGNGDAEAKTSSESVSGAVTGQPDGERAIGSRDPHPVMHVKPRMRPGEHALRRLDRVARGYSPAKRDDSKQGTI